MLKVEATGQLSRRWAYASYHFIQRVCKQFYAWRYLSWVILVVSALNVICIGGKRRAFGIFIAALHTSFNETSMTELNWIGDSYASLGFFLMPFATTAIIHFNRPYRLTMIAAGVFIFTSCMTSSIVPSPGYLFLTHTLLHGIGSTLVMCAASLVTGDYFDGTHPYHVLATTFVSGGPYGVLFFGPLFSYWIHSYSLNTAFVYSGVLFLLVTWLGGVTFLPHFMFEYNQLENQEATQQAAGDSRRRSTPNPLLRRQQPKAGGGRGWAFCSLDHLKNNSQVFLWALERLLHNVVIYGLLMNLTSYVSQASGNELVLGARINLYFGIGESIIFTIGAIIGDRIRGHLALVYAVGAGFSSLFLLIVQRQHSDINVMYVLGGMVGGAVGVGNTFLYATSEEVMLVHGSIAFPMTKMVAGVGMILAPLFSGVVIDKYGFHGFFISMAILVCIRTALLTIICLILHHKKKEAIKEAEAAEAVELAQQEQASKAVKYARCEHECPHHDEPQTMGSIVSHASPSVERVE